MKFVPIAVLIGGAAIAVASFTKKGSQALGDVSHHFAKGITDDMRKGQEQRRQARAAEMEAKEAADRAKVEAERARIEAEKWNPAEQAMPPGMKRSGD